MLGPAFNDLLTSMMGTGKVATLAREVLVDLIKNMIATQLGRTPALFALLLLMGGNSAITVGYATDLEKSTQSGQVASVGSSSGDQAAPQQAAPQQNDERTPVSEDQGSNKVATDPQVGSPRVASPQIDRPQIDRPPVGRKANRIPNEYVCFVNAWNRACDWKILFPTALKLPQGSTQRI